VRQEFQHAVGDHAFAVAGQHLQQGEDHVLLAGAGHAFVDVQLVGDVEQLLRRHPLEVRQRVLREALGDVRRRQAVGLVVVVGRQAVVAWAIATRAVAVAAVARTVPAVALAMLLLVAALGLAVLLLVARRLARAATVPGAGAIIASGLRAAGFGLRRRLGGSGRRGRSLGLGLGVCRGLRGGRRRCRGRIGCGLLRGGVDLELGLERLFCLGRAGSVGLGGGCLGYARLAHALHGGFAGIGRIV